MEGWLWKILRGRLFVKTQFKLSLIILRFNKFFQFHRVNASLELHGISLRPYSNQPPQTILSYYCVRLLISSNFPSKTYFVIWSWYSILKRKLFPHPHSSAETGDKLEPVLWELRICASFTIKRNLLSCAFKNHQSPMQEISRLIQKPGILVFLSWVPEAHHLQWYSEIIKQSSQNFWPFLEQV